MYKVFDNGEIKVSLGVGYIGDGDVDGNGNLVKSFFLGVMGGFYVEDNGGFGGGGFGMIYGGGGGGYLGGGIIGSINLGVLGGGGLFNFGFY